MSRKQHDEIRIAIYETTDKVVEGSYGDFYNTIEKSEAIERMAKASWIATVCAKNQIIPMDVTKKQWDDEWEKLRKDYKRVYYAAATAELEALLEAKHGN
jgi:hypothetical protein